MVGSSGPICAVSSLQKRYGGVIALSGVDLEVHSGEVHAIAGENGAGKSTLMRILAGAEAPDSGDVLFEGRKVSLGDVRQARDLGISIVFQELSLFPEIDVLNNLFPYDPPTRFGLLDRARMAHDARPVLVELGLDVDIHRPVSELRLSERQLVEIAKALLARSRVLIFDEPNSALNASESEHLFNVIRKLRERGVAQLYISHRLEEVFAIADRITVLRNGGVVCSVPIAETTVPQVVEAMIGRRPPGERAVRVPVADRRFPRLRVSGVSVKDRLLPTSFSVGGGEVLGLVGLEGSGAEVVLDVLFGRVVPDMGEVTLPNGRPGPHSVPAAVRERIAFIPVDRRDEGLAIESDIASNLLAVSVGAVGAEGFALSATALRNRALRLAQRLLAPNVNIDKPVGQLSGGNQQKTVIAKWLDIDPQIVLLNDPTRGVDVGAKQEIYRIIEELAADQRIVILISTELPEYVSLCDRVIVFYRGEARGCLERSALSTHQLLKAINTGRIDRKAPAAG